MAAPSIVDFTTYLPDSTTNSYVINRPTYTAGDEMYIVLSTNVGSNTVTPPTGFTAINAAYNDRTYQATATFEVMRKVTSAGEPTTYTVTNSGNTRCSMVAFSVSGANGVHNVATPVDGQSNTATIPSITPTVDECLLIACTFLDDPATASVGTLSGFTQITQVTAANGNSGWVGYKAQTTATTESGGTMTWSISERWLGAIFSIAPAAGGSSGHGSVLSSRRNRLVIPL